MTPRLVITTTALIYGLDPEELGGRSRTRQVAEARAVAAYLAYERTDASYAELGGELGRSKGTVAWMVSVLAERLGRREYRLEGMVRRVETELERSRSVREMGVVGS